MKAWSYPGSLFVGGVLGWIVGYGIAVWNAHVMTTTDLGQAFALMLAPRSPTTFAYAAFGAVLALVVAVVKNRRASR